jgi:hypothetical protein
MKNELLDTLNTVLYNNTMKHLTVLLIACLAIFTNGHTIKICSVPNGASVDFYAGSPHTPRTIPVGGLMLDGTRYDFTSVQNVSTSPLPSNAVCVDAACPYTGNPIKFFQKVTISGLVTGDYTVTTTCDESVECPHCAFPQLAVTVNSCAADSVAPLIRCPTKTFTYKVNQNCKGTLPNMNAQVVACDSCSGVTLTQSPPVGTVFDLGEYDVVMTARDAAGNTVSCNLHVKFVDKTPPKFQGLSASPSVLWPPNHKMNDITLNYATVDNCDGANAACEINSALVTSDEPDNDTGDGNTDTDWLIVDNHHVQLRAERMGNGDGRIYTVSVICKDSAANANILATTVTVPHNQ